MTVSQYNFIKSGSSQLWSMSWAVVYPCFSRISFLMPKVFYFISKCLLYWWFSKPVSGIANVWGLFCTWYIAGFILFTFFDSCPWYCEVFISFLLCYRCRDLGQEQVGNLPKVDCVVKSKFELEFLKAKLLTIHYMFMHIGGYFLRINS